MRACGRAGGRACAFAKGEVGGLLGHDSGFHFHLFYLLVKTCFEKPGP